MTNGSMAELVRGGLRRDSCSQASPLTAEEEPPGCICLRSTDPGVVQLPGYEDGRWATGAPDIEVWQSNRIRVEEPTPSIVVARRV